MKSSFSRKTENFVFHWKIKNLRYNTLRNAECISSPIFTMPHLKETKWRLNFYPNGYFRGSKDNVFCFLHRLNDKGPENIRLKWNVKTSLSTLNLKMEHNFLNGAENGIMFKELKSVTLFQRCSLLIIVCEFCCFGSNNSSSLSNIKRFLPSSPVSDSEHVLEALKELDTENYEHGRNLFQYPCKSFAQTVLCSYKSFVRLPFDTSILTGKKYKQIIPIILTAKCPHLLITISRREKIDKNEETDKNLSVEICCLNGKIDKSLLVSCQLSVFMDGISVIQLPQEKHVFRAEEIDVWTLKETIDTSTFENQSLKSAMLKIDFIFADGEVRSEILWEEITEDFCSEEVSCLSNQMTRLYKDKKFCDIALNVGNKTYDVHKEVLVAMSPVFSAMFDSDMAEKVTNTVDIEDLDDDTVEKLINFMYEGTCDNLEFEKAQCLFAAADKYQIGPLMNHCRNLLMDAISFSTVCDILSFADRHNDLELKGAAIKFICFCEKLVLNSELWKQLKKTNLTLICEVLEKMNES